MKNSRSIFYDFLRFSIRFFAKLEFPFLERDEISNVNDSFLDEVGVGGRQSHRLSFVYLSLSHIHTRKSSSLIPSFIPFTISPPLRHSFEFTSEITVRFSKHFVSFSIFSFSSLVRSDFFFFLSHRKNLFASICRGRPLDIITSTGEG